MAGGTFQRRHTMASRHEDPVEYCISDKVVERSSTREKLTQGMTSRRRSYSEPAYYSSTFTDFFPDSEGMLGSHLHLGTSDDRMGESWDDAKRFLIESRKLDLEISKDVERENMHLYVSEMLIAVMEQMQWRNMIGSEQNSSASPQTTSSCPTLSTSSKKDVLSSKQALEKSHVASAVFYASSNDIMTSQSEALPHKTNGPDDDNDYENSAEVIASNLLKQFSKSYKPRSAADAQLLVSYAEAPQKLLPVPNDIIVFADELGDDGRPIFLRGSTNWAPPRKQWIFKLHPQLKSVSSLFEQQQYHCGGCGIKVAKMFSRRMRYCDYYGRVFCQRCHQGARSRIPARIIFQWNFKEYPVCDIAYRFLLDNRQQPVINASAIDSRFYNKVCRMKKIRELRIKLVHIWSYIRLCNIAEETITEHGNLYAIFSTVPKYMLSDADVYSIEDLENVRKGELFRVISPVVRFGQYHIEGCEHCRAQAFVCELCDQKEDLLFPFQVEYVDRCEDCGSLSHQKCGSNRRKNGIPCPKCVRIQQNL